MRIADPARLFTEHGPRHTATPVARAHVPVVDSVTQRFDLVLRVRIGRRDRDDNVYRVHATPRPRTTTFLSFQ